MGVESFGKFRRLAPRRNSFLQAPPSSRFLIPYLLGPGRTCRNLREHRRWARQGVLGPTIPLIIPRGRTTFCVHYVSAFCIPPGLCPLGPATEADDRHGWTWLETREFGPDRRCVGIQWTMKPLKVAENRPGSRSMICCCRYNWRVSWCVVQDNTCLPAD